LQCQHCNFYKVTLTLGNKSIDAGEFPQFRQDGKDEKCIRRRKNWLLRLFPTFGTTNALLQIRAASSKGLRWNRSNIERSESASIEPEQGCTVI
jgi:hypothetical protein